LRARIGIARVNLPGKLLRRAAKAHAARFAFAAGIFFKLLVFIAIDPGPYADESASISIYGDHVCLVKRTKTVSFLLTSRSGRVIWIIETNGFVSF